jgi:hypothetical protein
MAETSHIRRPTTGLSFCGRVSARTPPVGVKVFELEDRSNATCAPCKLIVERVVFAPLKPYKPVLFVRRKKKR